jgi:hypothetical protein
MKDRYVFLKTGQRSDGEPVALIGDQEILGAGGVSDLRNAFRAHAAPRARTGVLTLTAAELESRIPELEKQGMTESVKAFRRAMHCINKKNEQNGVAYAVRGIQATFS